MPGQNQVCSSIVGQCTLSEFAPVRRIWEEEVEEVEEVVEEEEAGESEAAAEWSTEPVLVISPGGSPQKMAAVEEDTPADDSYFIAISYRR